MEILTQYSLIEFLQQTQLVQTEVEKWIILEISISDPTEHHATFAANKLQAYFSSISIDGSIFICNQKDLIVFAKIEEEKTPEQIKNIIEASLPEYTCEIIVSDFKVSNIKALELNLKEIKDQPKENTYIERINRAENVIMIADDDMFMRELVAKSTYKNDKIIQTGNGDEVVDTYSAYLPDILFLDIHLPGKDGLEILNKIMAFDQHAYVIMLSADSNKSNVISTNARGAKGFIAKPFTKEKIVEYINRCPHTKKLIA